MRLNVTNVTFATNTQNKDLAMFTIELSELEICQITECLVSQISKFKKMQEKIDHEKVYREQNSQINYINTQNKD